MTTARVRASARTVASLAIALALIVQVSLAERHFHPVLQLTGVAAASPAPVAPLPLQPADDCGLCQMLAMGAATDLPHAFALWTPDDVGLAAIATIPSVHASAPARGAHGARAPPAPSAIV